MYNSASVDPRHYFLLTMQFSRGIIFLLTVQFSRSTDGRGLIQGTFTVPLP
jgi:hypothetical protein